MTAVHDRAEWPAAAPADVLDAIIEVQSAVTAVAGDDPAAAAQWVADGVLRLVGHGDRDGAAVALLTERDERPVLTLTAVAGAVPFPLGTEMPVAGSLAGLAVETREVVVCTDTRTDGRFRTDATLSAGVRSMIIAPLLADNEVLGTVGLSSPHPDAFDATSGRFLLVLANCLGAALRQAEDSRHIHRLLEAARMSNTALRRSETHFRTIVECSPLGILVTELGDDFEVVRHRMNPAMATIMGFPADQTEFMHDTVVEADRSRYRDFVRDMLSGRTDGGVIVMRCRRTDGTLADLRSNVAAVRDDEGRVRTLISQVEDITAEREARRTIADRAQLLELARDAIIVRDLDGHIQYWNPAAERIYGWPAAAVAEAQIDRLLRTRWPGDTDRDAVSEALMADGSWEGEIEHVRADGERVVVLSRKALRRDEHGEPLSVLSINTDITDRRAAETRLAASEALWRSQFEHSGVPQAVRTADGRVESANPALADLLGCHDPQDLVGTTALGLFADDAVTARTSDLVAMCTGQRTFVQHEGRITRPDGTTVDVQSTTSVLRGADDGATRFVSIVFDITARREAERSRDEAAAALRERNAELERANRLKTDLIGMLGHEINTPLSVIMTANAMAYDDWAADTGEEERAHLALVDASAQRLQRTVRDVLDLVTLEADRLVAQPSSVRLLPLLTDVVDSLGKPVPVDCDAELRATVQPEHLEHMVANLLSNAAKYAGSADLIRARPAEAGVEIVVSDSGEGVPEQFREELFRRFTRDASAASRARGSGLGLYITHELARANGGTVAHSPTPGGGATFTITLPAG